MDKGQPRFRCGRRDHVADVCQFKTARCHRCGKLGHIVRVCRSRQSTPENNQPQTSAVQNLEQVFLPPNQSSGPEYTLFSLEDNVGNRRYTMNLQLDDRNVLLEVDTGASLSLMSEKF